VPDTYTETERQEGASWPLGSGWYELDAVLDGGARVTLNRFKAGAIDKQLALAKQRREEQQQADPSQQSSPPATTSGQTSTSTQNQASQQGSSDPAATG
jgi:hypothetical protein